ncbi:MAG TPA: hypothetical protein VEH31_17940, partial [Streptosporangiaceae bacterium]|nr:hypothetical protein [Streptosporangiaceae bacterium]
MELGTKCKANRGMAALLIRRPVFQRVTLQTMQDHGLEVGTPITAEAPGPVIAAVAATFEVSKQTVGIRL